jgi:hypothetical protein
MIAGRTVNFFTLYEFARLIAPDLWAEYERCRTLPFENLTAEDHAVAETEVIEDAQKLGIERGTAQFEKIWIDKALIAWNRYHHKAEYILAKEIPNAITAEINFGRAKITALDASNDEVELSKSQIARLEIDVFGNNLVLASDRAVIFHDIRVELAISDAASTPAPNKRGRGRPLGSGSLVTADAPLIEEMHRIIETNPTLSVTAAAMKVADRAEGGGLLDSRVRRLTQRYSEKFR